MLVKVIPVAAVTYKPQISGTSPSKLISVHVKSKAGVCVTGGPIPILTVLREPGFFLVTPRSSRGSFISSTSTLLSTGQRSSDTEFH